MVRIEIESFVFFIDTMDTKNLDFGLLVTLETLLAERDLTRAARRLNLTQPALSARLARFRAARGDPLLMPGQRGMVLTQRALEMMQPLQEALEVAPPVSDACASGAFVPGAALLSSCQER